VSVPLLHDSAERHVTGAALYVDDMPEPPGTLHAALVLSDMAHGRIRKIDLEPAVRADGVAAVIGARDIPGQNDIAPIVPVEPLFPEAVITHAGQPLAAIAAATEDQARAAARLVRIDVEPLPPILDVAEALRQRSFLAAPMTCQRGDVDRALAEAPHRQSGEFRVGGQEHFYLEGQVCLTMPGEEGDFNVHASTQHPTEVQHICARLLGIEFNKINVSVRRTGGGFGGKESNASWVAGVATLLARATRRPVKLRLPREIDMIATGKRHGFLIRYQVGFRADGRIVALDAVLAANGGSTLDHTSAVVTRALTHVDNCYWIPHFRAVGYCCKTNTVSNTAFRGYGGPQGVTVMEDAVEKVARHLGHTLEEIRAINFYGECTGSITPYGQAVKDNLIDPCVSQVMRDSDWQARRQAVRLFNQESPIIKRGLGCFPLKYGISFAKTHLNQAGAFINIYADGSIRLNHGGTEMGQGLFIKVAQVVAEVFSVDIDRIAITATSTTEVPNTSPTAGSTGSDLNGWAAYNAASVLKQRMTEFAAQHFAIRPEKIEFRDNHVHIGETDSNRVLEFGELAKLCWHERVSLSATGFYKTPDIHWDQATMKGAPYFYFSYGAAVAEVGIDTLTGETRLLAADLVQDCGRSLNPAIDLGQIEGGFVQGLGWLTSEELWWDDNGRLRTVGPSTYKIPSSRDVPPRFNVRVLEAMPARTASVYGSKGIGEPPIHLATAVWIALKDAIASVADYPIAVPLDIPATPERILAAVALLRSADGKCEPHPD
jgi:xanthine dehydrogenase large subunit